ncbi:MAG: DoxX family protein [Capsulimonas sp.]|uniref:DoxX family protein n=1 Tax=Capsulimonas sp. TaxID=2494211 RepID=UPI0032674168
MSTQVSETPSANTTAVDTALLVLRLFLGAIFIAHGSQKLFGAFGGHGLAATIGMFHDKMGIPVFFAYLAVFTEFFGGLAVFFGLLGRLASLGLIVTMLVALFKVHLAGGFFLPSGFEYAFALIGMALVALIAGPGRFAIADIEGRLLKRK